MAEYGEWNKKGATLSDKTAKTEYGVHRDFIIKGIESGKLEYKQGAVWDNPYIRILRRQLEDYIAEEMGNDYLSKVKSETELKSINKEIKNIESNLVLLKERKAQLEIILNKRRP